MAYRFPFAIDAKNQNELTFEEKIAADFITIHKTIDENTERIIKMSEILWPIMFIQSEPNFKLAIDNVGVLFFKKVITNAPRTAQIGHALRVQENNFLDRLKSVKKIMEFADIKNGSNDQLDNSEQEFVSHEIKGLIDPPLLEGIGKMIQYAKPVKLSDFELLERQYNFDNAVDFAQEWINLLKFIQGTRFRWNSLKDLIKEPIDKEKLDLKVKIKDISDYYKKKIKNTNAIDEDQIKNKLDNAKDNVDHWVLQEQKNIIEKIGRMFVGIDLIMEDIQQKNKYFLQLDNLKSKRVGEVVVNAYQNVAFIRSALSKSEDELEQISTKINEIREKLEKTNMSAEEKIKLLNLELTNKKEQQEQEIKKLEKEMQEKLEAQQLIVDNLIALETEIFTIINSKIDNCNSDETLIRKWQIDDDITHIRNPTSNFYIPIGIAIIEDEDLDEKISITMPSIYRPNLSREHFTPEFEKFEARISEILEDDMKLRSNFEFTCEKSQDYRPQILKGLQILFDKGLINEKIKQKYNSIVNSLE